MKTCPLLAAVVLSAVSFAAVAQTAPASAQTAAVAPQIAATERPKDSAQTWLIEFDRTAQSDGTIAFRVWPYDRAPVDVFIQVKKGDTENAIALAFRDAFRKALGVQDYQINDERNYVRISGIHGTRRFGLEGVVSTAEGVQIDIGANR